MRYRRKERLHNQNYDSNLAYQLAADYLQVRGGLGLGTTTTTTSSGSGGLTSSRTGGLGSATITTKTATLAVDYLFVQVLG